MIQPKSLLLLLILVTICNTLSAQQEASFTQYKYHMNIVNPAYVSIDDQTSITSTLRDQWTGVPDAPLTQAVSFGTTIARNLGAGISILNNENFVEKQTFLSIDISYKLKINYNLDLYFGIKSGGDFYKVNTSGLETYNVIQDPALTNFSTFSPNIGLGVLLQNEKYFVSISSPRILNTKRAKNDAGYASLSTDRPHLYLSAGYNITLNSSLTSLVLKPSALMRYVENAPISIDFNTTLELAHNFEIGIMYRTDQAIGVITDIKINKKLLIGYSYEWSTNNLLGNDQNTYELLLKYEFL